jgi:hypothetical protein
MESFAPKAAVARAPEAMKWRRVTVMASSIAYRGKDLQD